MIERKTRTVRLGDDLLKRLERIAQELAARHGLEANVSGLIRVAVERYADQQESELGIKKGRKK